MSQEDQHNHPESQDPVEKPSSQEDAHHSSEANVTGQEAAKLRQEQAKVDAWKQQELFKRLENSVYVLVGLLEVLLTLRFFFRLSGANPENQVAKFVYREPRNFQKI